jgi:hypothetical protein
MEEDAPVRDEIAASAQEIWNLLDKQGPSPLDQVRQTVRSEPHIFEWAVGWLAREDKIAIVPQENSFIVSKREPTIREAFI